MRELSGCSPDSAAHRGIACAGAVLHDFEKDVPAGFKSVDCSKRHGNIVAIIEPLLAGS
jgi:hypothetical protein